MWTICLFVRWTDVDETLTRVRLSFQSNVFDQLNSRQDFLSTFSYSLPYLIRVEKVRRKQSVILRRRCAFYIWNRNTCTETYILYMAGSFHYYYYSYSTRCQRNAVISLLGAPTWSSLSCTVFASVCIRQHCMRVCVCRRARTYDRFTTTYVSAGQVGTYLCIQCPDDHLWHLI